MNLHTKAVAEDKGVPDGRMGRCREVTMVSGSPEGVPKWH